MNTLIFNICLCLFGRWISSEFEDSGKYFLGVIVGICMMALEFLE